MMPLTKHLLADKRLLFIAIIYSCLITVLFFIPSQDLPKTQLLEADKIVHILVYFILVNLWMLYLYVSNDYHFEKKWIPILLLSILLYGIIIEIFQGLFTVSRSADILDVVSNLLGSLLGIFFFKIVKQKLKA
ncbi:VanZ family protein [Aequorivita aquimaris]